MADTFERRRNLGYPPELGLSAKEVVDQALQPYRNHDSGVLEDIQDDVKKCREGIAHLVNMLHERGVLDGKAVADFCNKLDYGSTSVTGFSMDVDDNGDEGEG